MTAKQDASNRGRSAASPWQMPPVAWRDIAIRVWNRSWSDNIGLVAAGVAFYGFLALVPLLGMLVLAYGLAADPATVITHVMTLLRVLPPDVAVLISQLLLNAVKSSEQTSGFEIAVALMLALYAGGNGAGAIMLALNIAYEEKEKRSLARFYGIALCITVIAVALALAALVTAAAIGSLANLLPTASGFALLAGKVGLYALMTLTAAGLAATLYRYGPSRENARWQWLTAGSLFTALMSLLLTIAFGYYVTKLTDYNATYGSIAAIVILLTWMYLTAYVFLFGAELNAELEHQTAKDSTTGDERPIGLRGAWAADHVAGSEDDGTSRHGPSIAEAGAPNPADSGAA